MLAMKNLVVGKVVPSDLVIAGGCRLARVPELTSIAHIKLNQRRSLRH
jgi:outer membrane murein-binding lipoprotein Lpp